MPLLCGLTLRKNSPLAIGSPGADSGGPASNPARVRRSPAGGEQGSGLGPTRVRFVGSVGGEELPAGGRTGGRWRWPPRLPVPVRWRLCGGGGYVGEL
jgi:hypothetical protein